jgi:hypothetical protein
MLKRLVSRVRIIGMWWAAGSIVRIGVWEFMLGLLLIGGGGRARRSVYWEKGC